MGSLKSSCTTSSRSSIEIIAVTCLVFEKIAFFHFGDRQTNRQTNKQTDRQIDGHPTKSLSLSQAAASQSQRIVSIILFRTDKIF